MHLVSSVVGRAGGGQGRARRAGGHLPRRHALSGAPKIRAMEIIDELEPARARALRRRARLPRPARATSTSASPSARWSCEDGPGHRAGGRGDRGRLRSRRRSSGRPRPRRARCCEALRLAGGARERGACVLLVDNYDSFTYNLYQYLGELGAETARRAQRRAHARTRRSALAPDAHRDLARPGHARPGRHQPGADPARRGPRPAARASASATRPSARPSAGRWCARRSSCTARPREIHHDGRTVFAGLPEPFTATRYHSLVVERATRARRASRSRPGPTTAIVMGLRHREHAARGRAVPSREHPHRARARTCCATSWASAGRR